MKEQLKKADLYGLLIIAAAMVWYWWRAEWTVYQTVAASLGAVLVVISLILKGEEIRSGLGRRSTRFGINSGLSVLAVVGILGLLNYLGKEHSKTIDMTEEKLYSLSQQSLDVIDKIDKEVTIKGFFAEGQDPRMRDILNLYSGRNKKITFDFIDPEKHPELVKQYQVKSFGTLIFEMAGNKERLEKAKTVEEDITNALTKLVKGEKKAIYFLEGHGERQLSDMDAPGYSIANEKLAGENYVVKPLSLAREGKVPADASVVVIAGPTKEPFPAELEALSDYLKGGGGMMLLLDPPPDGASWKEFARGWSIDVGDNEVIDRSAVSQLSGTSPVMALVENYGPHKIVEKFGNGYTAFKEARSIMPAKPPVEGLNMENLLMTSPDSWAESDFKSIQPGKKISLDKDKDLVGPVTIGVAGSKDVGDNKKIRIVAIGDSDFASNGFFPQLLDGNLFMNSIAWLSGDESFISIRAKDPTNREITMTQSQVNMFALISLLVIPGGILLAGISVWASRRK